jgi:hypothetical protein
MRCTHAIRFAYQTNGVSWEGAICHLTIRDCPRKTGADSIDGYKQMPSLGRSSRLYLSRWRLLGLGPSHYVIRRQPAALRPLSRLTHRNSTYANRGGDDAWTSDTIENVRTIRPSVGHPFAPAHQATLIYGRPGKLRSAMSAVCPFSGVKRTLCRPDQMSANDPKRTSTRGANAPSIQNDSARPQGLAGHSAAG